MHLQHVSPTDPLSSLAGRDRFLFMEKLRATDETSFRETNGLAPEDRQIRLPVFLSSPTEAGLG